MFFYQNPFLLQCSPQIFLYQAYPGPQQIPVLNPLILNQNQPRIDDENFGFGYGVKAQEGEERIQNLGTENLTQKQVEQGCDSEYQLQKSRPAIIYKNKNTETNLSNQIFSFLSSQKSRSLVLKLLDRNELKILLFYKMMKKIRKGNKKYMNRSEIIDLAWLREGTASFRIYKKFKSQFQLEELKRVLRILVVHFLRNGCEITLLTSKKMNRNTLMEHLMKRREFQVYFSQQLAIPN